MQSNESKLHTIPPLQLDVAVSEELLQLALTHPSAVGEGIERTLKSNQRLEFLGDAVVGAIVAEHLYRANATLPEGELTQRKATLVRGQSLARAARRLNLGAHLRLGRGEETSGGRERDTILADAMEAVIGAILLSSGWDAARAFVAQTFSDELANAAQIESDTAFTSLKNQLQEKTQAIGLGTPIYQTATCAATKSSKQKIGESQRFSSQVLLLNEVRGRGLGGTKKEAESNAAKAALETILSTTHSSSADSSTR